MKTKLSQTINNCDICQTLKYDRQPHKLKLQKTEKLSLSLDVLHTDLYTIKVKYIINYSIIYNINVIILMLIVVNLFKK